MSYNYKLDKKRENFFKKIKCYKKKFFKKI